MDIASTMMLLLRLWLSIGLINAEHEVLHRVFPAAQVEVYNHDSNRLGVVKPLHLSIQSFGPASTGSIVAAATHRFRNTLLQRPDFAEDYKENPENSQLHDITTIELHVVSQNVELVPGVNESYTVSIEEGAPDIKLRAHTAFGILRGLETLGQLLEFGWINDNGESEFVVHNLPLSIVDFPSFEFRGLLIDTSRHFLPLKLILANLDIMAMNKLNVLHWHLTDSPSFPFQARSMPELAKKGSYHPTMVYTTEDIQLVVREAYLRGIRVIPEVDLPGHTQSIAASHPELMSKCPNPSEPLDPTNPNVYDFVRTIYSDLADVFPDEYFHVGGDEVDLSCWLNSKKISSWMKHHNMTKSVELYQYFETRLLDIVNNQNKTPIVWQEVFNLNLTITKNTIIDIWKGFDRKTMAEATRRGFKIILSGCWYLDHLKDDWKTLYKCNCTNFTGDVDLIIGGHASMWGEHVDASNFISRVWPRASAVAERLWTGNVSLAQKNVMQRIQNFRCKMVQQGFAAEPIGPGFCSHEVPYRGRQHCNLLPEEANAGHEGRR